MESNHKLSHYAAHTEPESLAEESQFSTESVFVVALSSKTLGDAPFFPKFSSANLSLISPSSVGPISTIVLLLLLSVSMVSLSPVSVSPPIPPHCSLRRRLSTISSIGFVSD
ncbi:hypothetical protein ACFXTN_041196 [Malus domestica]